MFKQVDEGIFAYETVVMAILLGMMSWGGMVLFSHNAAIAEIRVEQERHDEAAEQVEVMHDAIIRIEEGNKHLKDSMDQQRKVMLEMFRYVQGLD